jgi:predicted phage baseplate assembly protein
MPLVAPNLDDRTFEQLLREARLRIPRYCPEWTDFNDSDPGMALVQLFAWFTETMLYQFNRVPELGYVKFLKLLNIQPRPAKPARVVVCFTPARPAKVVPKREMRPIPAGSRLEAAGDGGPVVFETTRTLDPVPYPLDAVQVYDGADFTDQSAANESGGQPFRPFGWTPRPGGALYLGFQTPADRTGAERVAFPDRVAIQVYLPTQPGGPPAPTRLAAVSEPAQILVWEYQSEFDLPSGRSRTDPELELLARWRRLELLADATAGFTREGLIEFRGPGEDILATHGGKPTPDDEPRYWVRCRLAGGQPYPPDRVPEVAFVRANAVEAVSLASYTDEVLGESDGFPRAYKLRHFPVDRTSVTLFVEPADAEPEEWKQQDDLLASGPDDPHFTVNAATGDVEFGNGQRGRVPPPGALVVARKYRAGGGAVGNVAAGAISNLPPGAITMAAVTNPRPAAGGTSEETLADLKEYAPHVLRGGDGRAVTPSDYERLAGQVDGVAKATAIPHTHPDYPGLRVPGAVTLVAVPTDSPLDQNDRPVGPQPTQALLDRVYRELYAVCPLGTELFVAPPRYRKIEVEVRVDAANSVSEAEARDGVRQAIERYLSPVPVPRPRPAPTLPTPASRPPVGPPAVKPPVFPQGWPFNEPFVPSRLYAVILDATTDDGRPLARSVTALDFTVGVEKGELDKTYTFDADELPVGRAEVRVGLPGVSAGGEAP